MLKFASPRVCLVIALVGLTMFFATDTTQAEESAGQGFTVSPPILELKANPGDQLEETVSLFNNGGNDLSISATVENLKPMGEAGQVQVIGDSNEGLATLKDWVQVTHNTLSLPKNATKNVSFKIKVPDNATPGGHFATILFGTVSTGVDSTGSLISQKIGTLVLLTVSGQATETAQITKFSPEKNIFWENKTVNFALKVKNEGNVYVQPRGFLVITNFFGKKVAEIAVDGKNILPTATREIPIEYLPKYSFGPYTATLTMVYGGSNQNLNSAAGFWVIPWLPTLIVLIVIALIFLARRRLYQAIRVLFGKD